MAEFVLKNNYFEFDRKCLATSVGYCYWHKVRPSLCLYLYGSL